MAAGPRYRIAPSPTGFFHVGGARTALFNWALARQLGGRFVLRVEDTDEARDRPEWTQGIIDALAWLGIGADDPTFEGPYFQSANLAAQVKDCAKPAGTAGGGPWLSGVEVGPVCPSHRFSEVGISSAEVR